MSWRILVVPGEARQVGAGINVAASRGQLLPETGLFEEEGELTHIGPQRSADANGDGRVTGADVVRVVERAGQQQGVPYCSGGDTNGDRGTDAGDILAVAERVFSGGPKFAWRFLWQAPNRPQVVEFFAAVVTANCNRTNGGDGFAGRRWEVRVESSGTQVQVR